MILGKGIAPFTKELAKETGKTLRQAQKLLSTELTRVQVQSSMQAMEDSGFDEYQLIANPNCCNECQKIDGKHYKIKDLASGESAPPMHPNCRCSIAAYVDSDTDDDLDEAAFDEWSETYDEHGLSWEEWQRRFTNRGNDQGSINQQSKSYDIDLDLPFSFLNNGNNDSDIKITNKEPVKNIAQRLRDKYKIVIDPSLLDIPEPYLGEGLAGIEDVLKDFPKAEGLVTRIRASSEIKGFMASNLDRSIYFNTKMFNDPEARKRQIEGSPGYKPKNAGLRQIGSHEVGHCLESYLLFKRANENPDRYNDYSWINSDIANEVIDQAYYELGIKELQTQEEAIQNISIRATVDRAETIAEAIADVYSDGSTAQPLSLKIFEIFKREI